MATKMGGASGALIQLRTWSDPELNAPTGRSGQAMSSWRSLLSAALGVIGVFFLDS
jgi:hypothetical protein